MPKITLVGIGFVESSGINRNPDSSSSEYRSLGISDARLPLPKITLVGIGFGIALTEVQNPLLSDDGRPAAGNNSSRNQVRRVLSIALIAHVSCC